MVMGKPIETMTRIALSIHIARPPGHLRYRLKMYIFTTIMLSTISIDSQPANLILSQLHNLDQDLYLERRRLWAKIIGRGSATFQQCFQRGLRIMTQRYSPIIRRLPLVFRILMLHVPRRAADHNTLIQ